MNHGGVTHALACIVLVLVTAGAAAARQARDPFTRGTVSLEFDAAFLGELWHLNERRESIAEGVQGIAPLVRWRVVDRGRWAMFAELGPGVSWSDVPTPPRGTKFNYLFQGSVGFLRQLGAGRRASFGVRFLHLSNNEREGVDRNPDLEMLGPFGGISFSF
jgi:hypothetical protein